MKSYAVKRHLRVVCRHNASRRCARVCTLQQCTRGETMTMCAVVRIDVHTYDILYTRIIRVRRKTCRSRKRSHPRILSFLETTARRQRSQTYSTYVVYNIIPVSRPCSAIIIRAVEIVYVNTDVRGDAPAKYYDSVRIIYIVIESRDSTNPM